MTKPVVAEVAIFGTSRVGHGFIVSFPDGRMVGNGEPSPNRSATAALWLGLEAVEAGIVKAQRLGVVRVTIDTADGRPLEATVPVGRRPWFGDLSWTAGRVFVLDVESITAAK